MIDYGIDKNMTRDAYSGMIKNLNSEGKIAWHGNSEILIPPPPPYFIFDFAFFSKPGSHSV